MAGEARALPNRLPRPAGELARLEEAWRLPRGWRAMTAVNNTVIGKLYIGTAFLFCWGPARWRC
jgi:cytochrome c oxidase subunit I+III